MTKITSSVLALSLGLAVAAQAAPNGKRLDPDTYQLRSETLTSAECQAVYLAMIENFVGWSESHFMDSDAYEPGGGYFDAKGWGVDWARGNSNLCIAYAVLLTAHPDRDTFTIHEIPRTALEDHLRKTIRFLCQSYEGAASPKWGPGWQVSLDFIGCAWAAHLVEERLDAETIARVRRVTCAVADSLDKEIPSRRFGDTGSEDCTWNAPFLAFAANKYADDARAGKWDEQCKRWALNALSTGADATSETLIDGRPLKSWIVSENVHPDLTIENHNMWSVGYQTQCQFFAEGELAYRVFGNEAPEAFAHHADAMWENVTRALFLWDGEMIYPTGQDWSWKGYSAFEYLTWHRLLRRRPEAGAYESRAIQMAYKRQLAVGTGALGFADFGNNTVKPKRWAFSWLCHEHVDDGPIMSMPEAYRASLGVYQFPHVKVAIHRAPTKCVSVSWHPKNQPIYIFPEGDSTFTNPPFFFPNAPAAGGVQLSYAESEPMGWTSVELLESTPAVDGEAMRVAYTRVAEDGTKQFVSVVSLPDEATVWFTAFKAARDGVYQVRAPFHYQADTIQGFPMRLEQRRGARWLNLSDHIGFVSSQPLPDDLPSDTFFAATESSYTVSKDDWFGAMAVAAYARQPHTVTREMAETFVMEEEEQGVTVNLGSSTGKHTVSFELPAE